MTGSPCARTAGCDQPGFHMGACNQALVFHCTCPVPLDPLELVGYSTPVGRALECRRCRRCVDPKPNEALRNLARIS